MLRILCVCIHNSSRSQMAEAFLNQLGQGKVFAQSAGLTPGRLNPAVVAVMAEIGIDISKNKTKDVSEFFDRKEQFDYVVTVCDEANAERCPNFPGKAKRLHWGFEDPASVAGSQEEKVLKTRLIRNQIYRKVKDWLELINTQD
jgi:arsenate reductase